MTMDTQEINDKYRKYLYGLTTYYKDPLPFVKGEGKWLTDASGRRYPPPVAEPPQQAARPAAWRNAPHAADQPQRTLQDHHLDPPCDASYVDDAGVLYCAAIGGWSQMGQLLSSGLRPAVVLSQPWILGERSTSY